MRLWSHDVALLNPLWGSWLQAVGPLLNVLFAFAIVCLAGATTRLAGWMTMFGGTILMMVSLVTTPHAETQGLLRKRGTHRCTLAPEGHALALQS
jgi:hypothetical protein